MRRPLFAFALATLLAGPLSALEGPTVTLARQLQLAAAHLAATAATDEHTLPAESRAALQELAAGAEGFRWELEGDFRGVELQGAWAGLRGRFQAARAAVPEDAPAAVRTELRRVHSLMNRLDRRFGGSGFWYGPHGWSG